MAAPRRKYADQERDEIVACVRKGLGIDKAAAKLGIDGGMVRHWMQRYPAFGREIARARVAFEENALDEIRGATTAHEVNARKFLLERLRRQTYGEVKTVKATVEQADPFKGLPMREVARRLRAAAIEADRKADEDGEP